MKLEVLSPIASAANELTLEPATRLADLHGAKVGLWWNFKHGGDVALRRIADHLVESFGATPVHYHGSLGSRTVLTPDEAERFAKECDVMIGAVADSGGAASWLPSDVAQIEQQGTPTVALVARGFEHIFRQSWTAFGMAGSPAIVVLPRVFNATSYAEIEQMIDDSMGEMIRSLTEPTVVEGSNGHRPAPAEPMAVEGVDAWDAYDKFNELFLDYDWSDGLPLVPPTAQAVERMLKGTKRDPAELVAVLEPAFGNATIETIAINAVMAGCKPDYLPVVVAAVEAIADPLFVIRDAIVATGNRAPLLLINGPIRDRLKINSGTCATGPGAISRANTAIGRTLRLIIMNVAGVYAGTTDISTMGSPSKYSLVAGENEEESPWEPYHVELGYDPEVSTVTAKSVFGMTETQEQKSPTTPERLTDLAVEAAVAPGRRLCWIHGGNASPYEGIESLPQTMWFICPHNAKTMADAGWDKDRIRRYLYDNAVITVDKILNFYQTHRDEKGNWVKNPHLQWLEQYPDLLIPIAERPDDFRLAVVGGPGSRGLYFYGNEQAVTKVIDE